MQKHERCTSEAQRGPGWQWLHNDGLVYVPLFACVAWGFSTFLQIQWWWFVLPTNITLGSPLYENGPSHKHEFQFKYSIVTILTWSKILVVYCHGYALELKGPLRCRVIVDLHLSRCLELHWELVVLPKAWEFPAQLAYPSPPCKTSKSPGTTVGSP